MAKILIVNEKFRTRLFEVGTTEQERNAALCLLAERVEEGYYEIEDEAHARGILAVENGGEAWAFLLARREDEYGWVAIQETEEI